MKSDLSEMSQEGFKSTGKANWLLKQLSYQGSDLRSLTSSQGDMGKKWMPFQGLNHRDHPIMAAHPQVIPLGDVMG